MKDEFWSQSLYLFWKWGAFTLTSWPLKQTPDKRCMKYLSEFRLKTFNVVWVCMVLCGLTKSQTEKIKKYFLFTDEFCFWHLVQALFQITPMVGYESAWKKKRKFIFGLVVPVWKRRQSLTFWTGLQCSQCGLYCFILTMSSLFHSRYLSRHATEEELCVTTQITTA